MESTNDDTLPCIVPAFASAHPGKLGLTATLCRHSCICYASGRLVELLDTQSCTGSFLSLDAADIITVDQSRRCLIVCTQER